METTNPDDVALFDLDGTLCDYEAGLVKKINELASPEEGIYNSPWIDKAPDYIKKRAELIQSNQQWWANLPKFKLGWDVLEICKSLEFRIVILTQGPRKNPAGWAGKKIWIDNQKELGEDTDIIITRDKSLVYGKVLVDDFPGYIGKWLKYRKNGLVIMPANSNNLEYNHSQVIRYDGSNLPQVKKALEKAKTRKPYEKLEI